MKIKVNNFAKIRDAEIEINGITIIAGKNNTGKSTIGKIVFSLFNSLNNMQEKIIQKKKNEVENIMVRNLLEHLYEDYSYKAIIDLRKSSELKLLIDSIYNVKNYEEIYQYINEYFVKKEYTDKLGEDSESVIKEITEKIVEINNLSNDSLACEITNRYFNEIFSNQINCLKNETSNSNLELTIKDKTIITSFYNNNCNNIELPFNILHEAYYIDDPFILDELSRYYSEDISIKKHMISKINSKRNEIMDNLFESVIAKEKLSSINKILETVVDGNIVENDDDLKLNVKGFNKPLSLNNLSTGLKSFVIIKMLLEKGILKEKDVLILDEPEIHLHPEWQLVYAEVIVLLQKTFDLSILVTTHSFNFLEAINYYSKKYKIDENCNYYLSKLENGLSSFENVDNNLEKIYSQMIEPSVLLDRLKYEMENDDE